jgi:hypothetical protein
VLAVQEGSLLEKSAPRVGGGASSRSDENKRTWEVTAATQTDATMKKMYEALAASLGL